MRTLTQLVIIIAIALIALYDVLAYVRGGTSSTISYQIWTWSKAYPVLAFAGGFVAGHLFWNSANSDSA